MSVVVAFKYKDGIIIGADRRVTMYGHMKEDTISKLSRTKYSRHVIGCVGYLRNVNLISVKDEFMYYKDILDEIEVDMNYMIKNVIPSLIEYIKSNDSMTNSEGFCTWGSELIYATNKRIFRIGQDFSVIEHPYWGTTGCGMEMAMGILSNIDDEDFKQIEEKDAIKLMDNCISRGCDKDSFVSPSFEYILIK